MSPRGWIFLGSRRHQWPPSKNIPGRNLRWLHREWRTGRKDKQARRTTFPFIPMYTHKYAVFVEKERDVYLRKIYFRVHLFDFRTSWLDFRKRCARLFPAASVYVCKSRQLVSNVDSTAKKVNWGLQEKLCISHHLSCYTKVRERK